MAAFGVMVLFVFVLTVIIYWLMNYIKLKRAIDKIQGPRTYPIIGNALQLKQRSDDFWDQATGACTMFQTKPKILRLWLMVKPTIALYGAEEAEVILTSNKHINKSFVYKFLHPWMGLGLLTSYAEKWRPRRKLLTPTFHYDILKDFIDVFNQQSRVLVKVLQNEPAGALNMYQYITLCALDIITQTAMGRNVNAQTNKQSDYVKAVYKLNDIIHQRQKQPWLWPDFMFYTIGQGKEHDWCLNVLHGFTGKVIEERSAEIKKYGGFKKMFHEQPKGETKKRLAFLDLLLDMVEQGHLTLQDVREETDTFMFEGHDTTSAGMNWALELIGLHPEVQERLHHELDAIFGDDDDRDITFEDLKSLTYMEMCIKEALRLFPSVPIFGRTLVEDCDIGGRIVPADTEVVIIPYMVHRDPAHWPDPEVFDPDRFLPENSARRHPFAYLPFSAGSRNCIGQRFALMEEKTVLAWLLRYFKVRSCKRRDQIRPQAELILRPSAGIELELKLRRKALS